MFSKTIAAGVLAVTGLFAALAPASAQTWPTQPITWIVPFAAGGGTDAFARPLAAQIEQQSNIRIVIENRGGAGGTLGATVAARAAPDGQTFFIGAAHHSIAPSLYQRLDYDIERDFIPIAVFARPSQVIVINPTRVPANTLAEFIAFARANPGRLTYGSAGLGTTHHLAAELFKFLTQTNINHIPYRGAGPAMQDLVAGQLDVMFDGLGTSAPQIQGGRLRGLAVAAPQRNGAVPNVPTAAEAGLANFEVSTWYAIWAPRGTPQPIIDRMTQEVTRALQAPNIVSVWAQNGSDVPTNLTGAAFATFLKAEIERWRRVVREGGLQIERPS